MIVPPPTGGRWRLDENVSDADHSCASVTSNDAARPDVPPTCCAATSLA
jgi:hypothetical protein